jgi:triosephosphate isomerase
MTIDKRTLIVGNWKMHLNVHQSSLLVHRLSERIQLHRDVEVVLAPSVLAMQPISLEIDRRKFRLAAQDAFYKDEGHFTGEVSFRMLHDLVHYAIIGHSARRIYFNESLEVVRDKVQAAVRNEIVPIICIGETKQERDAGETKQVIHDQVTTALQNLTSKDIESIVLVYEPTWAITTFDGIIAKPADVEKAVAFIRMQVSELYGQQAAERVRVLYGGSVNEHDVLGYLEIPGVDGALVGAASLNYHQFSAIVAAAHRMRTRLREAS